MTDFLNKIITLILIFILVILAPLLISYMSNEMTSQRLILNDVTLFIDKATDKGTITQEDLDSFYAQINAHGLVLDATVKRQVRGDSSLPDGTIHTMYVTVDNLEDLNRGDIIKVNVNEVSKSSAKRLLYNLVGVDEPNYSLTLAGVVK